MDENDCSSRVIRSTLYEITLNIGHFWQCRFQNGNFAIHTDLREIVTLEPRKIIFFLVLVKCHLAMVRNCGGSEMILVKPWFRIINLDSNSIDMNLTNCTIRSFWDYQQSFEISFFEILLFENYPTALEVVSLDWWEFDYLFEDFHFQILKLNFDVLYSPNELSSFVD